MATQIIQVPCVDKDGYYRGLKDVQPLNDGTVLLPADTVEIEPPTDTETFFYKLSEDKQSWVAEKKPTTLDECVALGPVSHESQTARCNELRQIFQKLTNGNEEYRITRGENHEWQVEKVPEKTEAEKLADAEKAVREERNRLLAATDYLLTADYPISEEDLEDVKVYRQNLRNVPEQSGFPYKIEWPEKPSIVK